MINDVAEGRAAIYVDLLGYDEVAHHSGPERADALAVLRDLDRQIARIARSFTWAPRPYHVVVLSDHGQTQGRDVPAAQRRDARRRSSPGCAAAPRRATTTPSAGARSPRRGCVRPATVTGAAEERAPQNSRPCSGPAASASCRCRDRRAG